MNENEVKSRLSMALEANNESLTSLARKIKISPKRLHSQIFGNNPTSLSAILRVAEVMPGISLEWLLRGSGEMMLTPITITENSGSDNNCSNNNYSNVNSTNTVGANTVTGRYATVIGQQIIGLSENFVRELLAAKDKQIQTLLALLGK